MGAQTNMAMMVALMSLLSLAAQVAGDMDRVLIDGAYCLDGSQAGYYYSKYKSPRAEETWVIYFQGGGLCYTDKACHDRTENNLGSSKGWGATRGGQGATLSDNIRNPDFWDANFVYIPYCTGDLHTGTRRGPSNVTFNLYMTGHTNVEAIVAHVKKTHPEVLDAKYMLVSGDSAGGMGTFYNLDYIATEFPRTKVKGAPVGGWFFGGDTADQPLLPWAPPSLYSEFIANKTGLTRLFMSYLYNLYEGYIPESCLNYNTKFHCGSVHVLYPTIASPIFVIQNMYDSNQLYSELMMPHCDPNDCEENIKKYVSYFGDSAKKSLRQVIQNRAKKEKDGLFAPSCLDHCGNINVGSGTNINGYTSTALLGNWFFERTGRSPVQVEDDCPGNLPCNPTCSQLVPRPPPKPETKCATELNTLCQWKVGCFQCALANLPQLFAATCTYDELEKLCN